MTGPRTVRAPRGTELRTKGWPTEAPLRMLMNNLDPDVAERPDDLVVYGGTGRAARSWEAYDAIVPSASAENALTRPSGASPRSRLNATNGPGLLITVAPPATAREQSPARRARAAWCNATSEDEQAVSMVIAGPVSPNV